MSTRVRISVILLIIAILILTFSPAGGKVAVAETDTVEALSIILLIDVSGSMRYTDPLWLRETAARIFIDLLSPEDYLGIIAFDHQTEVLLSLQQVSDFETKEVIKQSLEGKLGPRGHTDYIAALEAADGQFEEAGVSGTRPVVVLLTDGEPDPGPGRARDRAFMASYMESLWQVVHGFALERIPVYTVGFSEEISPEILERMARDTQAGSYVLNEPAELLLAFFKMLGNMKNRRMLFEETVAPTLEQRFVIQMEEHVRQVNLVVVAEEGGEFAVSLTAPGGEAAVAVDNDCLFIMSDDKSSLIVLQQPGAACLGEWVVTVSSEKQVRVMADADLNVKGWLLEPAPFSQHSINEPFNFLVNVTGDEKLRDMNLQVEVVINGPGLDRPAVVRLIEGEDGYFRGSYEKVDRTGSYELLVRVQSLGRVLNEATTKVYVRIIPVLRTDFWVEKAYRMGEETVITASLLAAGNRLAAGGELKVENFQVVIDYSDGVREVVLLHDSGDFIEHGDLKATDGIWSNRYIFSREGKAEAVLLSAGVYRETEFFLERKLGSFVVHLPSIIQVDFPQDRVWSGGTVLLVPVDITNESAFAETLLVSTNSNLGTLKQDRILLEPHEKGRFNLEIELQPGMTPGLYNVVLAFAGESGLTPIAQSSQRVSFEVLSRRDALVRRYSQGLGLVGAGILVLLLVAAIFTVGGLFLYRLFIYPRKKVTGSLIYRKTADGWGNIGEEKELKLGSASKQTVVVSFDMGNRQADFHIEGSEFAYDLTFTARMINERVPFLQGWDVVLRRASKVKIMLQCSRPGVLEIEGKIFTRTELFHGNEFESGGFFFQYLNPYGRWSGETADGKDILEGKV